MNPNSESWRTYIPVEAGPERITCAAIHFDDGKEYPHPPRNIYTGLVITGHRHCNCYAVVNQIPHMSKLTPHVDGFLTNYNRFVDRSEGYAIAKAAGQLIRLDSVIEGTLYSENIY